MAKGTLKLGRMSHKKGRLFVQSAPQRTLLLKVGSFARTIGELCVRKSGNAHIVCTCKGKGLYTKGVKINNSAIVNRWRYTYAKGA